MNFSDTFHHWPFTSIWREWQGLGRMTLLPLPFNLSRVNQTQAPSLCNHVGLASLTGLGRTFLPILIFTNVVLLGWWNKAWKRVRKNDDWSWKLFFSHSPIVSKSLRDCLFSLFERISFEFQSFFFWAMQVLTGYYLDTNDVQAATLGF